ncbi:metallophosphoesterase [Bacillus sp. DX1.1]|uniref:metallophosphoesterase n=1 Tax=unclassified Bacillus (in: firmicutes) TaxID=185979 RepID=UPI0025710A87|nr:MULTISPECIES: metallophosphoesterase [unclassified Bacillus (in: firmicutes)]MDM5156179.1 metallophosphoesterase [Bacillus sp. DX1.1]WJE84132.1 metallophosphoesterase [Bacillus sp. DX3.1]
MNRLTRRKFIKSAIRTSFYTCVTTGLGYYYAKYIEPRLLSFTHHSLRSPLIPKNFHGVKIVQFSDLHLGYYFSLQQLSKIVSKINETQPDIVFFTGDLIDDYQTYSETPFVSSILRNIRAPLGKFAIYGNHDHGGYGTEYYSQIMREAGFEVLQNAEKRIYLLDDSEISIFGIDDMLLGNPEIDATLQHAQKEMYTIVLVHEPDIAPKIANFPVNLQLSGHSHGGQVQLPFFGAIVTPTLAKHYIESFYHIQEAHSLLLYVNRGLGTTRVPFRFMARPEITVFTLQHP